MIRFEVNQNQLKDIEKRLKGLSGQAPKVLKNAINSTATKTRKDLSTVAQKTYVVKSSRFNKATKIKKANVSNIEAVIRAKGKVLGLKDFKVSPASVRAGSNRPDVVKAKVLQSSKMKPLKLGDNKAFVVRFKNGKVAVAQRKSGSRYPIKTLYSNSVPKMLGNEKKVYGIVEPKIYKHLTDMVNKQIDKVLGG